MSERHPVYDKVARVANQILRGNRDLRQIYDKVGEDLTATFLDTAGTSISTITFRLLNRRN